MPHKITKPVANLVPAEILALAMPATAWRWVARWLLMRRRMLGPASDAMPWGRCDGLRNPDGTTTSRGTARSLSWGATLALHRAGAPPGRLRTLRSSRWPPWSKPVPFGSWCLRMVRTGHGGFDELLPVAGLRR